MRSAPDDVGYRCHGGHGVEATAQVHQAIQRVSPLQLCHLLACAAGPSVRIHHSCSSGQHPGNVTFISSTLHITGVGLHSPAHSVKAQVKPPGRTLCQAKPDTYRSGRWCGCG